MGSLAIIKMPLHSEKSSVYKTAKEQLADDIFPCFFPSVHPMLMAIEYFSG